MRSARQASVVLILAGLVTAGALASSGSVTFAQDATSPSATEEKPLVQIQVSPGWNLISLPGAPADPAINTVIDVPAVDQVITTAKTQGLASILSCNPHGTVGPECLTAQRQAGDPLTGNLTIIDGSRGYWVHTATFQPILVDIPTIGVDSTPPSTHVYSGWDIVGVTALDVAPGTLVVADSYFVGTHWTEAYTFDTVTNAWTKLLPMSFSTVTVGKGYYLATPSDSVLIASAAGGGAAGPSAAVAGNQATLSLLPGMNLASLPGTPVNPAINAVFPVSSSVNEVVTYDPVNPDPITGSPWLFATRDASGQLTGNLTQVAVGQGYLITTTVAEDLVVQLVEIQQGQEPSYPVVAGYNLLGVTAAPGAPQGNLFLSDAYFSSVAWRRGFFWTQSPDSWGSISPFSFGYLRLGAGYWVYLEQAGQLVPFGPLPTPTPSPSPTPAATPSPTPTPTLTPTPTPIPGVSGGGLLLMAGLLLAMGLWTLRRRNPGVGAP